MKLSLHNEADIDATAEIASLQNFRSIPEVIAAYTVARGNSGEDFEITISKNLLAASYAGNPSSLASKVLSKLDQEEWKDSAGYQTQGKRTHITIKILRAKKTSRRINPFPSVKALIRQWLDLNLPSSRKLRLPIETIPAFYISHSEQLTYAIRQETQTPIKITKLKSSWLISRK